MSILTNKKVTLFFIEEKDEWGKQLRESKEGKILLGSYASDLKGVPVDTSGRKIDPLSHLSDKEKDEVADKLSLGGRNALNPNEKDGFWTKYRCNLSRKATDFDLSKIDDFVKYWYLLAHKKFIAKDWNSRYDDNFRYAFKDDNFDNNERLARSDKQRNAYKFLDEIEVDKEKMRGVLRILGFNPSMVATGDELRIQLLDIIESGMIDRFLEVKDDKRLEYKILVEKGLSSGEIEKQGKNDFFVKELESSFRFDELVEYLSDPKNKDFYVKLVALTNKE